MGGMCRMLTSLLAFQCRSNTLAADLPKYLLIFNPSLGPLESLCFLSCLTLKYAYPVPVFFTIPPPYAALTVTMEIRCVLDSRALATTP